MMTGSSKQRSGRGLAAFGMVIGMACWVGAGGGGTARAAGPPPLPPEAGLAWWTFDEVPGSAEARDTFDAVALQLEGPAAVSADGAGRTGQAGDRALDLGTTGSADTPSRGWVDVDSEPAWFARLNDAVAGDRLTVVFWQRWSTPIQSSSTIWFLSPSANNGERGWQSHVPWGNGQIYFDTTGCCASPAQRLVRPVADVFPNFDWQQWHHFAFVKDGGAKSIWVDGQLLTEQSDGAAALVPDWRALLVGHAGGEPQNAFHGLVDDLAVYAAALTPEQIQALAGGASPGDLLVPREQWPPRIEAPVPEPDAMAVAADSPVGFTAVFFAAAPDPTSRLRLWLNGEEVTSHLQFEVDGLQVRAQAPGLLEPGRYYVARAAVTVDGGDPVELSWTFATAGGGPAVDDPLGADVVLAVRSSVAEGREADLALDGDPATVAPLGTVAGAFWEVEYERPVLVTRVDLLAPVEAAQGVGPTGWRLTVEGIRDQVLLATNLPPMPAGAVVSVPLPPDSPRARLVRIENPGGWPAGDTPGLAEVTVRGKDTPEVGPDNAPNLALGRESYMLALTESLPPPSNANDGDLGTYTESTERTVGAYWEVDLGEPQAVYLVRVYPANGLESRVSHATVRLYDAAHDSVYAEHLGPAASMFEVALPGPVIARYVRVGFENKERSSPTGGIEWHLGLKEVEVYGRPAAETGLLDLTAEPEAVAAGGEAKLNWQVRDVWELDLHPGVGSVGAAVDASGAGSWTVSPTETTEYTLVAWNANGPQVRQVTVTVDGRPAPPQISEFLAANRAGLRDGFRETSDWIELHNPNNTPLDLAGYGLSDDAAEPFKWQIPEGTVVPPHGYLVVFASGGRPKVDPDGFLHTGFTLDAEGESLLLSAPDGTLLDAVAPFPAQRDDLAYGRDLEGAWRFLEPTPGAPNVAADYDGWLAPVEFSQPHGFQDQPFDLTLSHPDPEATILVSTDGSDPTEPYTGPIRVDRSMVVRARVERPGFKSPRTQAQTYLFLEDTLASPTMNRSIVNDPRYADRIRKGMLDLPTICITVPELPDDWVEREAVVEIFGPGGEPWAEAPCGVKRFGGAWTTFAKKNYRLKFRDEYGVRKLQAPLFEGFDHGIPPVDTFDELDLRGGGHDASQRGFYLSARFSEDKMLEMGSLNPHGRFAHVYFNGRYWGQYHLRERLTDAFLADYLGGRTEDYVNVRGNDNVGSGFVVGTPDPKNRKPWLDALAARGHYEELRQYVDIPHLIDFMLMWWYGNAESEFRAAGPIVPGSGFKFWLGDADGLLRPGTQVLGLNRTGNRGPADMFGSLVDEGHPDFMTLLADRIYRHCFHGGALTPERNQAWLDERMAEIADSLLAECARWGYRTPDNWLQAAQINRNQVFPQRTAELVQMLRNRGLYPSIDPPEFNQEGGRVPVGFQLTMTAGAGEIWYTTDGSDPRAPVVGAPEPVVWITSETPKRVLIPSPANGGDALGEAWRGGQEPFDDSAWTAGTGGVGYDRNTTYRPYIGIDVRGEMEGEVTSAFIRIPFEVTAAELAQITTLALKVRYDDGFVAFLNGVQVAADNAPADLSWDAQASGLHSDSQAVQFIRFELGDRRDLLHPGLNILAIHGLNRGLTSSDFLVDVELEGSQGSPAEPSSTARRYTGPIPLEGVVHLKARARRNGEWSALHEALFAAGVPVVVLSEVHYHPADPTPEEQALGFLDADEFEFLELTNPGPLPADLTGARFDLGIRFDFTQADRRVLAPGETVLLVSNRDAFTARYGDGLPVIGQYEGRLSNGGETLRLLDALGQTVIEWSYDDAEPWPPEADGLGPSLELRDLAMDPADPASWRVGPEGGSPGRLGAPPAPPAFAGAAVVQGQLVLQLDVPAEAGWVLERALSLSQPVWTAVTELTAGQTEVSVPLEPGRPQAFYRIRSGP
ncbi:MAG: hypothetical protein D6766_08635 [Verrucomicrobia bacterium]|nr:MAG: hypothetical protein D6766_08635 [Verrucomicrobiota bacterium]